METNIRNFILMDEVLVDIVGGVENKIVKKDATAKQNKTVEQNGIDGAFRSFGQPGCVGLICGNF